MRLTAVDLFSGPGGLTLGLKRAGFQVVGAIEVDPIAVSTYEQNHPDVPVMNSDIGDIDASRWMKSLGLEAGRLDLLAACPPCQGFSRIRTRNKASTEDCRNDLVLDVVRFVRTLLPKTVMVENVPGLLKDSRLESLLSEVKSLGFDISGPEILNVCNYGVPQNRKRLVFIGSRIGLVPLAVGAATSKSVKDAIGHLPKPGESGDYLHDLPERRSSRVRELISAIPEDGGSRRALPERLRLACHQGFDGFKDVYGRMAWDSPAPTITGGCFNPSKGRFLHPSQNRNISLREAALLQGFPMNYVFSVEGGKSRVASMIGNALPPSFAESQARNIGSRIMEAGG